MLTISHTMKKLSIPSVVLIALIIALGVGFQGGMCTYRHFSDGIERQLKIRMQLDKADVALRALKQLRDGSTITVPFLETQLDDVLVLLRHLIAETLAGERGESERRTVRQ